MSDLSSNTPTPIRQPIAKNRYILSRSREKSAVDQEHLLPLATLQSLAVYQIRSPRPLTTPNSLQRKRTEKRERIRGRSRASSPSRDSLISCGVSDPIAQTAAHFEFITTQENGNTREKSAVDQEHALPLATLQSLAVYRIRLLSPLTTPNSLQRKRMEKRERNPRSIKRIFSLSRLSNLLRCIESDCPDRWPFRIHYNARDRKTREKICG